MADSNSSAPSSTQDNPGAPVVVAMEPRYVLVPVEPTPQMLQAASRAFHTTKNSLGSFWAETAAYRALLAAAPASQLSELQADAERMRAALEACLPFIDDADDVQQYFPESASSDKCRAAVAAARAALKGQK